MTQYIPTEQLVLAPWDRVVHHLEARGWIWVPQAIRPALWLQLAADSPLTVPGRETEVARSITQTTGIIQDLAVRLNASLSVAAQLRQLPPVPVFDRVVWTFQPCIDDLPIFGQAPPRTALPCRDAGLAEVSIVVGLQGTSTYWALRDGAVTTHWNSHPGDLLVLRGRGWPKTMSLPAHLEADPPTSASPPRVALVLLADTPAGR